MKHKNFLLRVLNLLVILGVLWQYQNVALSRADAVAQRSAEIKEVEAYNASVLAAASEAAEEPENGYRDGTYEGSAYGFGDIITVSVTIADGKVTDISVLAAVRTDPTTINRCRCWTRSCPASPPRASTPYPVPP